MGSKTPVFFTMILMAALMTPALSVCGQLKGSMEILEEYRNENAYRETDGADLSGNPFNVDAAYNLVSLYPRFSLSLTPRLKANFMAEITSLSSIEGEGESETGLSLVTLSMGGRWGGMRAEGGLIPVNIGGGYLFSDDEPGFRISAPLSSRHRFTLQGALIYRASPFITAELKYQLGFFETVSLFGAFFVDKDDSAAAISDWIASNTGSIFWGGGAGEFFIGRAFVSLLAMAQTGSLSVVPETIEPELEAGGGWGWNRDRAYDIDLSGYLIDLSVGINVTEWLSLSSVFFVASGDRSPLDKAFEGFISLMPGDLMPPVFFEGVCDPLSEESFSFLGVNRQGVIAKGAKMAVKPLQTVTLDFSFVWLYAHEVRSTPSHYYGWEADSTLLFEWKNNRTLFIEIGTFQPEGYFSALTSEPERLGRVRTGFHLAF
jgi:hypothetical protein